MGCVIAFLSIFVIAGLSIFFLLTVRPIVQIIFANDWVATPAIVTSSQLETHPSSEGGPTYSIDIRYRYTFDGEDFEGDRYNFAVGSSSEREGKQAVVNRYPVGTETTCYVDPDDAASAVLFRKFGAYVWAGLFGLPFLIVPFIIFQVGVRQRRRAYRLGELHRAHGGRRQAGAVPEPSGYAQLGRRLTAFPGGGLCRAFRRGFLHGSLTGGLFGGRFLCRGLFGSGLLCRGLFR